MENQNPIVNVTFQNNGTESHENHAEVVLRHGEAPSQLEPKAPVKTNIHGVIGVVQEYLKKRVNTGQFSQERSHIIVNRENLTITLIINEDDEYTRGKVVAELQMHPSFVKFGINQNKTWTPVDLGVFFKMNRTFFESKEQNMVLVTQLMNYEANIQSEVKQSVGQNGNRTDNFNQVVNSNLPEKFNLVIPIFKGMPAETIEVETFAKVNGRDVLFVLLSPGANVTLEDIRNKCLDEELDAIREIAPNIAIIEE